jgi:N-acetylglucosamine transport system permease protein
MSSLPRPLKTLDPATSNPTTTPANTVGHVTRKRWTPGDITFQLAAQVMLVIWAIIVIYPFIWMIITSFKSDVEIMTDPFGLPANWVWENFERAWSSANIGTYVINTLIVMAMSLTGTLFISAMAAYAFSRFSFPGNRFLSLLFTAGLMFPTFLGLVPLYFLMDDLYLRNSYIGLALVYIAYSLPFTIFFLIGFFKTLPGEIAEAAYVDGASEYQVFFQIMLPMAKPGLIAMAIFNFLGHWNQYLLPLVLMQTEDRFVLSQGLSMLSIQQGYNADYSALFAAMTITMVPTLIVYILFQNRLEDGMTAGALKG